MPNDDTRDDSTAERIRRLFDGVWNDGDPSVADDLVHPKYVIHDREVPPDLDGPAGYRWLAESTRAIFPDATFTVDDVVADGGTVAVRWTMIGTHDGDGLGVEPTGEVVTLTAVEMDRFEDGLLAESWVESDMLGVLEQVGAV